MLVSTNFRQLYSSIHTTSGVSTYPTDELAPGGSVPRDDSILTSSPLEEYDRTLLKVKFC